MSSSTSTAWSRPNPFSSPSLSAEIIGLKPVRPLKNPLRYSQPGSKEINTKSPQQIRDPFAPQRDFSRSDSIVSGCSSISSVPSLSDCSSLSSGGYNSTILSTPSRTRAGSAIGMDPIEECDGGEESHPFTKMDVQGLGIANISISTWLEKEKVPIQSRKSSRADAPGKIDLRGLIPVAMDNRRRTESNVFLPPVEKLTKRVRGLGFDDLDGNPTEDKDVPYLWQPADGLCPPESPKYGDIFEPRPPAPRIRPMGNDILELMSPLDLSGDAPKNSRTPAMVRPSSHRMQSIPQLKINGIPEEGPRRASYPSREADVLKADIFPESRPTGIVNSPPLELCPSPRAFHLATNSASSNITSTTPSHPTRPRQKRSHSSAYFSAQLTSRSQDCPIPPSLLNSPRPKNTTPTISFPHMSPRIEPFPSPIIASTGGQSGLFPPIGILTSGSGGGRRRSDGFAGTGSSVNASDLLFRNECEAYREAKSGSGTIVKGSPVRKWGEKEMMNPYFPA